ncbi:MULTISPECIES: aminotransferase class IV [Streptomyces]|uniref:Aminotransferase class IV n=1 Tax=Streptomyces cavourensis TaxID=67258 RepID=A0ABY5F291_9ACTN|nr:MULTISPECIES: aminotransferase class IV [Streptomyces]NUW24667.1 aminotransferase [Streptomyces roseoviolaceus]MBH0242973.1 aminotransferase class IV [Streptomyces cavourensis]NUV83977.1 aminotransferase [Streptomyces sp. CAI-155]NUV90515.1 aminotransferase [Streptomyces sp. KAI-26]UTR77267.1 aminotransferase class IV [Streptomyces cavourensis]
MVTLDGEPVTADGLLPLALTNLGHFTTFRVDADGTVRGLSRHLDRLVRDCAAVFGAPLDTDRVRDFVRRAVAERELPCVVRVTVHDPAVDLARPADADAPRVLVSVRRAGPLLAGPLRARSVTYERDLSQVKHTGLFGALHARRAAQLAGYDDALFVGRDGYVTEGATWNVGLIDRDGTVLWPRSGVLPGVTMALLREHPTPPAQHRDADLTLEDARVMVAAFATNAGIGVRPLAAIDGTGFAAEHPLLGRLREAYLSIPGEAL